ncbi:ABC transporter permease [Patescibacteria group bacterium]|nr:ABC transporter permease [Patescibacteria group bacterium]
MIENNNENYKKKLNWIVALRDYGIYIALFILILAFCAASSNFAEASNFILILLQASVTGIISIGMLFVILTGGIDLSVGSTLALAGILSGIFAQMDPLPLNIFLAISIPLIIGLMCGIFNGFIVAWGKVPALIVTLGTMYAYRGFVVWYRVNPIYNLQKWYRIIGQDSLGPIPIPVVLFFIIILIAYVVLNMTRFGRYVYAVGGNEPAAKAAGINVRVTKLCVYAISGLLCGLAGLVFTSRLGAAQAISGEGFEMTAIASVVVGGASLTGGKGSVGKTVIGSLIIQVLSNGLVMLNVPSTIQQIIIGMIIISAVGLDNLFRKSS